jgi:hypothetical protein
MRCGGLLCRFYGFRRRLFPGKARAIGIGAGEGLILIETVADGYVFIDL